MNKKPNSSDPGQGPEDQNARPREETLKSETFHVERKSFVVALCENARGQFLRISEEAQGRRNSIIVPAGGIDDFLKALQLVWNETREV